MVWEQRWHPLREEWVVVAAHRQGRPWAGRRLAQAATALPARADACQFCPGNRRSNGQRNPEYSSVWVFDNDHPCVGPAARTDLTAPPPPYRNRPARGAARVVCYTPRHDLSLAELPVAEVEGLLRTLQEQCRALAADPDVAGILVFENRGEAVGVSNPHPHCQIYATNFVFKTIEVEVNASARHWRDHGRALFADILAAEQRDGRRLLDANDTAVAFVPYFARWAYEVFVAPRRTHRHLTTLDADELRDLAVVLRATLVRYDNLWQQPFPYVMVLHQAPTSAAAPGFHCHLELLPPLRAPGLLKHLAGPEIGGGNFLSDTEPEAKAAELRAVPTVHYKQA